MKKLVGLTLVVILMLSISLPALAGSIVTPNGGRAILWRYSTSSGSDYVAYISSGNSASLLAGPSNGRYKVNAWGYNSASVYAWYTGWVNTSYYVP